jgi:hypothetical protein
MIKNFLTISMLSATLMASLDSSAVILSQDDISKYAPENIAWEVFDNLTSNDSSKVGTVTYKAADLSQMPSSFRSKLSYLASFVTTKTTRGADPKFELSDYNVETKKLILTYMYNIPTKNLIRSKSKFPLIIEVVLNDEELEVLDALANPKVLLPKINEAHEYITNKLIDGVQQHYFSAEYFLRIMDMLNRAKQVYSAKIDDNSFIAEEIVDLNDRILRAKLAIDDSYEVAQDAYNSANSEEESELSEEEDEYSECEESDDENFKDEESDNDDTSPIEGKMERSSAPGGLLAEIRGGLILNKTDGPQKMNKRENGFVDAFVHAMAARRVDISGSDEEESEEINDEDW